MRPNVGNDSFGVLKSVRFDHGERHFGTQILQSPQNGENDEATTLSSVGLQKAVQGIERKCAFARERGGRERERERR